MDFWHWGMIAAIGTLCARMTETLIVLIYAHFMNQDVKIRPRFMIQIDRVLAKDYLIYAMPVVLNEMMWGLGVSANTAVISHLGSAAVASNSVAQVARQLAQVVVFGITNATAVYLGKTIRERKFDYAKAYAKDLSGWHLLGCCGACVILICAPIANTFLVLSPEAKRISLYDVWRHVLFCHCTGSQYNIGSRCISLRRRYEVRINSGCVYDVGIFYIAGCSRSIFLTRKCTGRLYTSDE